MLDLVSCPFFAHGPNGVGIEIHRFSVARNDNGLTGATVFFDRVGDRLLECAFDLLSVSRKILCFHGTPTIDPIAVRQFSQLFIFIFLQF